MTMIPTIVKADFYNMKISKDEGELFVFEYEEGYDKDNKDHREAFQNMEQIRAFHEQMLSTYGRASLQFDRNGMTVKLIMKAPFEKIANFISMEFLTCGSLGKMTLLDFVSVAASSMVSSAIQDSNRSNEDMYV